MKTRSITFIILFLVLAVLLTRNNEHITDMLLGIINPIKQNYKNFTQNLEDKSKSYIFQQESIEKLSHENRILRKQLLEQTHYIKQIQNIYTLIPTLNRLPLENISITETISYVKLNSFSQIILTKPKDIKKDKLYGLIQNQVVAGIAQIHNNQLYGYLTSDSKCRFSVFLGEKHAPGIAIGVHTNEMVVKFIPKWHKIKKDDRVITSGLDNIFFAGIPVGIVTKVEVQSSYKIAHIKTYSDIYHPKVFFLINSAKPTLLEGFDTNKTLLKTFHKKDSNASILKPIKNIKSTISSIPSRIDQTQEDVVDPQEPVEKTVEEVRKPKKIKKKRIKKKHIKRKRIRRIKRKPKTKSIDLF
ncbi:MAG: rod shape-determining protein MreC [Sulfurovum sp.]|nr:MAG: rod shape-determining protein MreC [Sulfurovum sp.]